MSVELYSSKK